MDDDTTIIGAGGRAIKYTDKYTTADIHLALQMFISFGVCVLVLSRDEFDPEQYVDGVLTLLETATTGAKYFTAESTDADGKPVYQERDMIPFDRHDPKTALTLRRLNPSHGGLFQYDFGHSEVLWRARLLKGTRMLSEMIYEHYLGYKYPLVSSVDGMNVSYGGVIPEEDNPRGVGTDKGNLWLHFDQAPRKDRAGFRWVQTVLNGNDVRTGDATLMCMPGSAALFEKFIDTFNPPAKDDWFKLTDEHIAWYLEQGCQIVCLRMPAGSQIHFDSRTVHQGSSPIASKFLPEEYRINRQPRVASYISFSPIIPGSKNTSIILRKRAEMFNPESPNYLRMTTHTSMKFFPRQPRTYGVPYVKMGNLSEPIFFPPNFTEEEKRVVGLS